MMMMTTMKMIIILILITINININTKILLCNNPYNVSSGFIFWLSGWIITYIAEIYFNPLKTALVVFVPYGTVYML